MDEDGLGALEADPRPPQGRLVFVPDGTRQVVRLPTQTGRLGAFQVDSEVREQSRSEIGAAESQSASSLRTADHGDRSDVNTNAEPGSVPRTASSVPSSEGAAKGVVEPISGGRDRSSFRVPQTFQRVQDLSSTERLTESSLSLNQDEGSTGETNDETFLAALNLVRPSHDHAPTRTAGGRGLTDARRSAPQFRAVRALRHPIRGARRAERRGAEGGRVSELAAIFGPEAVAALEALIDARVEAALSTAGRSDAPEWLSVESAARYLDVSPERVRKLQSRRELPYYQEAPGARVFFHRLELDEAMARWHRA